MADANLSFNIDSTPAQQAGVHLDALVGHARKAESAFDGVHSSSLMAGSGIASFGNQMAMASGILQTFSGTLQGAVTQLQAARSAMEGLSGSFSAFDTARMRAEAFASALGTSAAGMELFARQASQMHMTSIETATSLSRVTAAIEGQTAAGRQLRAIMQNYGVVLNGVTSSQADQVLMRFAEQVRSFRATPANTQAVQQVLGPLGVDALTSVENRSYEPARERENRLRVEAVERQVAELTNSGAASISRSNLDIGQMTDLRRNYDLSRLSAEQTRQLTGGMDRRVSQQNPRDQLDALRYLDIGAPAALRDAARIVPHFWEVGRQLQGTWADRFTSQFGNGVYSARMMNVEAQADEQRVRDGSWFGAGGISGLFSTSGPSLASRLGDSAIGRGVSNAVGTFFGADRTRPLEGDTRPLTPNEIAARRAATSDALAPFGFAGVAEQTSADGRLTALRRGGNRDTPSDAFGNLVKAYTVPTGRNGEATFADRGDATVEAGPRYANAEDRLLRQRDRAMLPGADQLDDVAMQRWLQSQAPVDRGQARALLTYGRSQGVSVSRWADNNVSPSTVLSGGMLGAGSLSPTQIGSFSQIQRGSEQNTLQASNEDLKRELALQTEIRDAMRQGAAEVDRVTASRRAYNEELAKSGNGLLAVDAANKASTMSTQRAVTAGMQSLDIMREKNDLDEVQMRRVRAAGSDLAARTQAQITGGILNDIERENLRAPMSTTTRSLMLAERLRGEGIAAVSGAGDTVAAFAVQVQQQRELAAIAGTRADVQRTLVNALQATFELQARLNAAEASGSQQNVQNVRDQIAALAVLKNDMETARATTENENRARDRLDAAGVTDFRTGMNPQQRHLTDPALAVRGVFMTDKRVRGDDLSGTVEDDLQRIRRSEDPEIRHVLAGYTEEMLSGDRGAVVDDTLGASFAQSQSRSQIVALRAGQGDGGARLASARLVDPRQPNGALGSAEASDRVAAEFATRERTFASQTSALTESLTTLQARLAAWKEGSAAGEREQRHEADNTRLRELDQQIADPANAGSVGRLRDQQTQIRTQMGQGDTAAGYQSGVTSQQRAATLSDQDAMTRAQIAAGPFASPQKLAAAEAGVTADQALRKNPLGSDGQLLTKDQLMAPDLAHAALQQQLADLNAVKSAFQQFEGAAESAFASVVLHGERGKVALHRVAVAAEEMLLKTFVMKPLEKMFTSATDSLMSGLGTALFGGSSSGSGRGAVGSAASSAASAVSGAATAGLASGAWSWITSLFAQGGVMENAEPIRYFGSGGLLTAPTRFMAAGGPVVGGEQDVEAVMPLKRLPNGNLGIAATGGGGHTIIVQAPVTIQGGSAGKGGGMDAGSMAGLQKQMEASHTAWLRNVLANEMRDGGDLNGIGRAWN
jgi:hypothetical protein